MKKVKNLNRLIVIMLLVCSLAVFGGYLEQKNMFIPSDKVEVPDNNTDVSGEVPEFESALEAFLWADKCQQLARGTFSQITGTVKGTSVGISAKQSLISNRYVDDLGNIYLENYSEKDASSSFGVNHFQKTYYDYAGNKRVYDLISDKGTAENPNFSGAKWTSLSDEEYYDKYASYLDKPILIINESTVARQPEFEKTENGWYGELILDNISATPNYKINIKENSGAASYPIFSKIHIKFNIGFDGFFVNKQTQETYQINMFGFDATTNTDMNEIYYYRNQTIEPPFVVPV